MAKLNSAATQKAIKILAKLIYIAQQGPTHAAVYRIAISGAIDQIATGASSDANILAAVGSPVITAVNSIAKTLDGVAATAKKYVAAYLSSVMAPDMGLPVGASTSAVLSQLVADMTENSDSVAPSGAGGSNANGLAMYFWTNFGVALPQNADPTLPDSWIAAAPV